MSTRDRQLLMGAVSVVALTVMGALVMFVLSLGSGPVQP